MSAAYVPIGEVEAETSHVQVYVDPHNGFLVTRSWDDRGTSGGVIVLSPVAARELTELLAKATALTPTIKAAYEVRMRARATAEDTYDRIVNRAVGGAR